MSFIVEHKMGGKKVRQVFAYRYPETLETALRGLDVVRVYLEDGKTRVFWGRGVKSSVLSLGTSDRPSNSAQK